MTVLAPQALAGDSKTAPVMGKLLPGKTDGERWKLFQAGRKGPGSRSGKRQRRGALSDFRA